MSHESARYKVLDCRGAEWSRYRFFVLARDVADRCTYDATLAARAPFRVESITDMKLYRVTGVGRRAEITTVQCIRAVSALAAEDAAAKDGTASYYYAEEVSWPSRDERHGDEE